MIPFFEKISQIFALLALSVAGLLVALVLAADTPPGCGVKSEESDSLQNKIWVCGNYIWDLPPKDLPVHLIASFEQGKGLFNNNCQQCHSLGTNVVVGPGLKGIFERRSIQWLIPWISNPQKVIDSGDPYATSLYNQFQQTQMPSFQLSNKEIKSILFYLSNRGQKEVVWLDSLSRIKQTLND